MTDNLKPILDKVSRYYDEKIVSHGPCPRGVDWNSQESQDLRFKQLLKVVSKNRHFSIIDLGCGYGRLFEYMTANELNFHYVGIDVSEAMIYKAHDIYGGNSNCEFVVGNDCMRIADYAVGSGILNVRMDISEEKWEEYVRNVLYAMNRKSKKGFSFNCLTKYSEKEHMRNDLYYADPCFYFDFCKKNFSRNVALLHDYDLYEFTIIVRKG